MKKRIKKGRIQNRLLWLMNLYLEKRKESRMIVRKAITGRLRGFLVNSISAVKKESRSQRRRRRYAPPKSRAGFMIVASAVLIIMAKGSRMIRSQRMAKIFLSKILSLILPLVVKGVTEHEATT